MRVSEFTHHKDLFAVVCCVLSEQNYCCATIISLLVGSYTK